jgi:hypothetical protein
MFFFYLQQSRRPQEVSCLNAVLGADTALVDEPVQLFCASLTPGTMIASSPLAAAGGAATECFAVSWTGR